MCSGLGKSSFCSCTDCRVNSISEFAVRYSGLHLEGGGSGWKGVEETWYTLGYRLTVSRSWRSSTMSCSIEPTSKEKLVVDESSSFRSTTIQTGCFLDRSMGVQRI